MILTLSVRYSTTICQRTEQNKIHLRQELDKIIYEKRLPNLQKVDHFSRRNMTQHIDQGKAKTFELFQYQL
jgi:hypothetical protein